MIHVGAAAVKNGRSVIIQKKADKYEKHAIYLEDSYTKEMDAHVLELYPEGEKRWRVILDKTVFYPMGGGQPTDQGKLGEMSVYQVMMKDGEIWHYIQNDTAPEVGQTIHGTIDWNRRYQI